MASPLSFPLGRSESFGCLCLNSHLKFEGRIIGIQTNGLARVEFDAKVSKRLMRSFGAGELKQLLASLLFNGRKTFELGTIELILFLGYQKRGR